jgi:FAD/FMN-containing dehydrogenase
MSATLNSALVAGLAGQVSGSLPGPQGRRLRGGSCRHNDLVDRRSALIVRCRTACDVAAALARRAGLEVSIRGGGHNVAGAPGAAHSTDVRSDLAPTNRRWRAAAHHR